MGNKYIFSGISIYCFQLDNEAFCRVNVLVHFFAFWGGILMYDNEFGTEGNKF